MEDQKKQGKAPDEVLPKVKALAATQHSVISVDQMIKCGATRTWIGRRYRDGYFDRVGPSVYRMGGVAPTFENKAMAAILSTGGEALVSYLSAAFLYGIGGLLTVPGVIDVTVPFRQRRRARPFLRFHESRAFDLAGATKVNGIPVTGVARTLIDCATVIQEPLRMLDDACRLQLVTWPELWGAYLSHRARGRELAGYRAVLEKREGNAPAGSNFNRLMADMLVATGVPEPVFEHRVVVDGHVYYLDLAWPERMVAVECNDEGSHRTGRGFARDPMKRNRCEGVGWRYLEYTWLDLREEPGEIAGQVVAALGLSAA